MPTQSPRKVEGIYAEAATAKATAQKTKENYAKAAARESRGKLCQSSRLEK